MCHPYRQRLARLGFETVTLIDADDPTAAAGNVAEHGLDNLDPHAEPLQASRHAAPQVMGAPIGQGVLGRSRFIDVELAPKPGLGAPPRDLGVERQLGMTDGGVWLV